MPYIFRGNLRAYLCDECWEPLRGVIVRLYRPGQERVAGVDGDPHLLNENEVGARDVLLLGEAATSDDGSFTVRIDERQQRYDGGDIVVDVRVESITPGQKHEPVQVTVAVVKPDWQKGGDGYRFDWRYVIAARIWCYIRRWFDAWVICGRLLTCRQKVPVAGATVHAYDADWLQDDALGTAVTDPTGHFAIHYTSAQFRKTPFSPGINVELTEGPDLYFKANLGPTVLVNETQSDGRRRGRENVRHCYCVELCTENARILTCALTGPTGCVLGDGGILPDRVLEVITGTAAGTIFSHYTIETLYNGVTPVGGAIVYPDAGGNPDPAATQGNTAVVNGKLGWFDLLKAVEGAGVGIGANTSFTLRMTVFGTGGEQQVCTINFQIVAAEVYIKSVGGRANDDFVPENAPLKRGAEVASVGGSVAVNGAANVFGCNHEKIAEYRIWAQPDASFSIAQPNPGTAFNPPGWNDSQLITHVVYSNDNQRVYNVLDGNPDPDVLTRGGWTTRLECASFGWPPHVVCNVVPHLPAIAWPTTQSGKWSVLLGVMDTSGHTYYDIQRVWLDNHPIIVALTGVGGLPSCMDLYTREKAAPSPFRTVEVRGTAWDELIVGNPAVIPDNNFDHYLLDFQKQGAAGWVTLANSATSVPPAGDPVAEGVLATWNLATVDAASDPLNLGATQPDQLLQPNEACTYILRLQAWDTTLVSHSTVHYDWRLFPIKVINAPIP